MTGKKEEKKIAVRLVNMAVGVLICVVMVSVVLAYLGLHNSETEENNATKSDVAENDTVRYNTAQYNATDYNIAYYEFLTDAIEKYGIADRSVPYEGISPEGIYYAGLIDFDNNDIPELLMSWLDYMEATMFCIILGYNEQEAQIFLGEGYPFSTGPNTFYVVEGADGEFFLLDEMHHWTNSYKRFYRINSRMGQSEIALDCTSTFEFGNEVYEYFINDEPVSENEYNNAPKNILGISNNNDSNYDLYDTNPEAVNGLLANLKENM